MLAVTARARLPASWLIFACILVTGAEVRGQQGAGPSTAPAVTVARASLREVTPAETFTARIEAKDSVDLRARVTGFLEQRLFEEGADVQEGQLLLVIEKAPYEAAVAEVQASIVRAEATLKLAGIEVERRGALVQRQAGAQMTLDEAIGRQGEARGDLLRQQAALQKAELDLSYTDIKAPLSGRIGRANFSVGDLVGPDSGALATIVAQDPIYVTFPISQRQLLEVRRRAAESGDDPRNVVVRLRLADGSIYSQSGRLDFIDIRVDPGTDTVQVRAEVPNPDRTLIDGQLVTAVVEAAMPEQALAIPQQALQADQAGLFVLVVDGENKAQVRRVQTGIRVGGDIVVTEGLSEGDRVITEGIQRVRPQQVVAPAEAVGSPGA
jgi:membrane fusion protein (multidrug efflux system)